MAQPYSNDFRQKVIEAIELDGLKQSEVAQLCHLSRNTINLWFQRQVETGAVKPKPRQESQAHRHITDWEPLRAFVKATQDQTQAEMAPLWDGASAQRTLSRALQKIGQPRKRTYGDVQRDEAKRATF